MWIKICGNTRLEDCRRAAELGVDAVGFVFAAGKRTVTAADVAAITPHLPATLETIGVFTSRDAVEIVDAAREAGLTGVQLHGDYDPALARAVRGQLGNQPMFRLLQVVHWDLDRTAEEQAETFVLACRVFAEAGLVDGLLIDSRTAQASGGTGRVFDWDAVRPLLAGVDLPIIVAGGLRPENVADSMRALRPFGVDVSSGVEQASGRKDHAKLARFVAEAAGPGKVSGAREPHVPPAS